MKSIVSIWVYAAGSIFASICFADTTSSTSSYSEINRRVITTGDHESILIRVRPPALPKAPQRDAQSPRPLTDEEAAYAERVAEKAYATLQITATVYLGKRVVTELRWRDDTGANEYCAWSNVDFRYLTQLTQLESDSTVYSWFPFLVECDLSDWPKNEKSPVPTGLNFSRTEAEYFVDARAKDLKSEEATLAGLDYLHAYYQLHQAGLKADHAAREKENARLEQQLRENPPKVPDTTLRWWPVSANSSSR
jgi:hypothetical protein